MPLSDLARETPSHSRRSFITLERILCGKFHDFVYHASKTWRVCNVERNAIFIKERCYHSIPYFGSWLLRSFQWKQTILQFVTVKVVPNIVCFHNFAFKISRSASVIFLKIHSTLSTGLCWKSDQTSKKKGIKRPCTITDFLVRYTTKFQKLSIMSDSV